MRRNNIKRRGMAAVIAVMYLGLFATLAIGFYASVTTSVQVSGNEKDGARALAGADSMMQFVRYHLAKLNIPRNTTQGQIFATVASQIQSKLSGTWNMGGNNPTVTTDGAGNGVIYIPGRPTGELTYIDLGDGTTHGYIVISQLGTNLRVKAYGIYNKDNPDSSVSRIIQLDYGLAPNASSIFNYGVASKSPIAMNGNTSIIGETGKPQNGSVLSATTAAVPLTMTGSPEISGDFSFTNATGTPSYGSGTIAGYSSTSTEFAKHIHKGVTPPEFPEIDSSVFAPYAPPADGTGASVITSSSPPGKNFSNIRIKAGTNPSFNSQTTLKGVIYIEAPNNVSFGGGTTIQGVIVTENNPSGSVNTNSINFTGNTSFLGVETLDSTYGSLRQLKGSAILAPKFNLTFGGNFGTVAGTIVGSKMRFHGNAGGTVKGTVINLEDTAVELSGNSDIIIASQGTTNYPPGVYFGSHFSPLADTYKEVMQ